MYLDVTSYMLTVLTFSVGFLSTRRHAHFDVLAKDLADRSWKIRQILNAGQDLGPRDLAEDVAAVTADPDSVSSFARVVNASFFLFACVVVVLGVPAQDSGRAVALLVALFVSTALVFALGEYDVRWMVAREKDLAAGTILGQLAVIDRALRSGEGGTATDEVARIREAYPHWVFGRELELALAAISPEKRQLESGGDPLELLKAGSNLHAAPVLAAEAQLERDNPIRALQDFQIVVPRSHNSRIFDRLQLVLAFAAGLPRAVFAGPELPPSWLRESSGLEIGLRSLPSVRKAAEALNDFGSGMSLAEWLKKQPETPAWLIARAATVADDQIPNVLEQAKDPKFSGALNSLGIVLLSRRRDAEALRVFEAAIRLRPNSSTSHWGRALACARRDWRDPAYESLDRARSLDPTTPVLIELTEAVLDGRSDIGVRVAQASDGNWSGSEAIQLALLGQRVSNIEPCCGARRDLTHIIIESALQ